MAGGKHPANAMHTFRPRTKHFRYTLELFREVYGARTDERLEILKPVRDALGDLNDCAGARELPGNGSRKMRAYLKKRARKKIAEFEECWRGAFDAPGPSKDWLKYLSAGGGAR
jgi:CHAD domain-containing protein